MYDELEITDELYIETAHRVRRREGVKFKLREDGKYPVIIYDEIVTREFLPRR